MRLRSLIQLMRHFARTGLISMARERNRLKYPGLGMPNNVNLDIRGDFTYGKSSGINEGANIIIPEHASLKLGDGCYIGRYVELGPGGRIAVGNETSVQDRCILLGDITIGRYCSFAPNVYISSGRHYFDLKPSWLIKDQDKFVANDKKLASSHSKPVIIEDDCWLGINVVVMSGVTIGKGAVIGANAVVTQDVEPYSVVAGAPAKLVKRRLDFSPPQRINYKNYQDLPYFYSGFEISQSSLEKCAVFEGIEAKSEFVICLDADAGSSIHLTVKNIGATKSVLRYENEEIVIFNEMQEVIFLVGEIKKTKLHFYRRLNGANSPLIVQEAWITGRHA